jgi:hypothetical protein
MSRMFTWALMLAACLAFAACKEDEASKTGTGAGAGTTAGGAGGGGSRVPATSSSPTRAGADLVLQEFAEALAAKDYDKALTYFHVPPGATAEAFKARAPEMVAKEAVSKEGVEILGTQGKWGKLAEVIPEEQATALAERAQVPADQCYGMSHGEAEAGFYWTGQDFKVIHCINVGKLKK